MVQDTDNLEMPIDKSNGLILLTEEQANYSAQFLLSIKVLVMMSVFSSVAALFILLLF